MARATRPIFATAMAIALACVGMTSSPAVAGPKKAQSVPSGYTARTTGATTVITDSAGWFATFTQGARTVTLRGPQRTFAEPDVPATVTTTTWVRLLPAAFGGSVDWGWLDTAVADRTPDALAIAFQYVTGAPDLMQDGLRIAGNASYGALQPDGDRPIGSDFNDYLGIAYDYGTSTDQPEPEEFGALDCSGFVRMVFGYRLGYPMSQDPSPGRLPRTSNSMSASGPGAVVIANSGESTAFSSAVRPGDLVFFDASTDNREIDHVGIFLGTDSLGHARFISSRRSIDGPTMTDSGTRSYVDGTGMYATAFRGARRI